MTLKSPLPDVIPPDNYVHGSVNAQISYWKRRAESAEARILLLVVEVKKLRAELQGRP